MISRSNRFSSPILLSPLCMAALCVAKAEEKKLPDQTYMPVVIDKDFEAIFDADQSQKPDVMDQQKALLDRRYDLSDQPSNVLMSARRKAVQAGVRVRLPEALHGRVNRVFWLSIRPMGCFHRVCRERRCGAMPPAPHR